MARLLTALLSSSAPVTSTSKLTFEFFAAGTSSLPNVTSVVDPKHAALMGLSTWFVCPSIVLFSYLVE